MWVLALNTVPWGPFSCSQKYPNDTGGRLYQSPQCSRSRCSQTLEMLARALALSVFQDTRPWRLTDS